MAAFVTGQENWKLCQFLPGLQPQNLASLIRSNDSSGCVGRIDTPTFPKHTLSQRFTWIPAWRTGAQPHALQRGALSDSGSRSARRGAAGAA